MSPQSIALAAAVLLPLAASAQEATAPTTLACPPVSPLRTVSQAFADRNAALAQGNVDLAMCAYAEDAVVILPGTILTGRAQIKAGLANFGAMFGGAQPEITSATATDHTLLITYRLVGPQVSVPDGSDTFVALFGRIRVQTVHATLSVNP